MTSACKPAAAEIIGTVELLDGLEAVNATDLGLLARVELALASAGGLFNTRTPAVGLTIPTRSGLRMVPCDRLRGSTGGGTVD